MVSLPQLSPKKQPIPRNLRSRYEPIRLLSKRFNYWPDMFQIRGTMQQVYRIIKTWEERGSSQSRCFQVECRGGQQFILSQDLRSGIWQAR